MFRLWLLRRLIGDHGLEQLGNHDALENMRFAHLAYKASDRARIKKEKAEAEIEAADEEIKVQAAKMKFAMEHWDHLRKMPGADEPEDKFRRWII